MKCKTIDKALRHHVTHGLLVKRTCFYWNSGNEVRSVNSALFKNLSKANVLPRILKLFGKLLSIQMHLKYFNSEILLSFFF